MATPPQKDNRITLEQAVAYTRRYQTANPGAIKANMGWIAGGLGELLGQPQCAGIRIYNGLTADGVYVPVIVGVDAKGEDISTGILLEEWQPCPFWCPVASPL